MIRTMLALEQARLDFVEGKMKTLQQHHDGEPCEETLQGGDRGVNEISSSPERDSPQNSSELTTTTRIVADIESLAPPLEQQHQQQVISPSTTGVVSTAGICTILLFKLLIWLNYFIDSSVVFNQQAILAKNKFYVYLNLVCVFVYVSNTKLKIKSIVDCLLTLVYSLYLKS